MRITVLLLLVTVIIIVSAYIWRQPAAMALSDKEEYQFIRAQLFYDLTRDPKIRETRAKELSDVVNTIINRRNCPNCQIIINLDAKRAMVALNATVTNSPTPNPAPPSPPIVAKSK